jgi:hypothetical protein
MADLTPEPPPAVPASHGWLIAFAALLGTVLVPVAVWCVNARL